MKPRYVSDIVLTIDTPIFFLTLIHPTIEYLQLHLYVHHLLCYHLGQITTISHHYLSLSPIIS